MNFKKFSTVDEKEDERGKLNKGIKLYAILWYEIFIEAPVTTLKDTWFKLLSIIQSFFLGIIVKIVIYKIENLIILP